MAVTTDWWPSTADVAAVLRVRSRTSGLEGEVGEDFSATSSPTKDQVSRLIRMAAMDFRALAGHRDPCSAGLRESAAGKIVYLTCRLIEISYRPEGADSSDGAVQALAQLWDDSARALAAQIAEHCPPDPDEPDIAAPGTALRPAGRVPGGDPDPSRPYPPQLGLKTRW